MNQSPRSRAQSIWQSCLLWLRASPILVGAFIASIGIPLAIAAWLLYRLLAPLFSPNPWAEYQLILANVSVFALVIGGLLAMLGVIAGLMVLGERYRLARWFLNTLAALLIGAIAVGGILKMSSGYSSSCVGFGRHSNC